MFRSFFKSWKWAPISYGLAILIFVLLILQTLVIWRFTDWMELVGEVMEGGYQQYTMSQFADKYIYAVLKIIVLSLAFDALNEFFSKLFCWFWFEALICYYLPNWNKTLRDISNPSERLHNSADDFTQKFLTLTKGAIAALLVIGTGSSKLYYASADFSFDFDLGFISLHNVPGLLLYIVVALCIIAILITRFVGRNFKKCRNDIRTATGTYRSGLEYIQRNKNEPDSIPAVERSLKNLRKEMIRLFINQFWFDMWMGIYTQFWSVVPLIFFGFNVFSKHTDYGKVTKTQGVLNQVYSAYSTPIWYWDEWTNFMSTVKRLQEMEDTINNPENWKEPVKEKGWEDRRRKIITVDATGKTIELSRADIENLLANFDDLPDKKEES